MANERDDPTAEPEHDPYARRPGYVTSADGRTDRTTTAMVAGVVTGVVALFLSGFLSVPEWAAVPVCVVIGVVVWLVLRARQRGHDRAAGRSPDAVPEARDRAVAAANGGRRFFVAQNPVVVIVMGGVFLGIGVVELVRGASTGGVLTALVLGACAAFFVVQGVGTLVVRRRERTPE
jgi:hypothetical protein